MADADVTITAGSGTKIDTRTVGAGTDEHRQVVVIGDPSTAANVALVDATFGLDVDVTRIVPGVGPTHLGKQEDQAHVDGDTGVLMLGVRNHNTGSTADGNYSAISVDSTGNMNTLARRDLQRIAVTVAGTSITAYASGDQVGTLCTLANAARLSGGTGVIVGVSLQGYNDQMGSWDVIFFDNPSVTLAADNAVFNIATDADILESVAIVPLAGSYDLGANRVAQAYNLAVPYLCSGGTSLYAALLTRGGFTNASGEVLQLVVYVERN
ncbi:hypothetical protein UFOVP1304_34 [uncultured Caudovirales phage]|uniref:Uncharacterized protein n=1 Tax=uncultured Caudovirales phage TaxID=2100421 RepID=A0A6J5RI44_9CAUD|nr:hypothetical protein UFOVP1304_34 [uncultured Caudovirales phage]